MDRESAPEVEAPVPPSSGRRGSVLDVVSALFAHNDRDAAVEVVRTLVAENEDMVRRLARIASRFKNSEKVGKAQLVLFLDALQRGEGEPEMESEDELGPDEVDEADAALSVATGIDDLKRDDDLAALKTRRKRHPVAPLTESSHLPHTKGRSRADASVAWPPHAT